MTSKRMHFPRLTVWSTGNDVGRINQVALRRARLVLRWVTVRGHTSWDSKLTSHSGQSPTQWLKYKFGAQELRKNLEPYCKLLVLLTVVWGLGTLTSNYKGPKNGVFPRSALF